MLALYRITGLVIWLVIREESYVASTQHDTYTLPYLRFIDRSRINIGQESQEDYSQEETYADDGMHGSSSNRMLARLLREGERRYRDDDAATDTH